MGSPRGFNVNRLMEVAAASEKEEEAEDAAAVSSSPHSASSSFQMEFCIYSRGNGGRNNKRESEGEAERASSRASDEDDNGGTRKKLRLSKEQSAFLEESFKEHSTLNPVSVQHIGEFERESLVSFFCVRFCLRFYYFILF